MKDKWADIGETKGAAAKLMKRRKRSGSAPFASDARARSRRARKVSRLEQKKADVGSGAKSPALLSLPHLPPLLFLPHLLPPLLFLLRVTSKSEASLA